MTIYDIIILAVIGIFSVWGLWRGIIREAFDAAGLVIGVLAARQFAPAIGADLPPQAVPQVVRTIIVSVLILLVIWLIIRFVGAIVRKIIRHGPVKSVDRLGGFLVGALKGIILVLALAILVAATPLGNVLDAASGDSPIYGTTMKIAHSLANRYREALGTAIKKSATQAVASVIKTSDPQRLSKAADQTASNLKDRIKGLTTLKISLDTLSPKADRLVRELLRDDDYLGLTAGVIYDGLKSSGTTVDIDLNELSPEARAAAIYFIEHPSLENIDLDKISNETGLDLEKMMKHINPQTED